MALRVDTKTLDGKFAVTAAGEIDLYTSPELRDAILNAPTKPPLDLIIDLSGVEYMDSSGVATLVEGYKRSLQTKTSFTLVNPSPSVMKVLQLSRLDTIFVVTSAEPGQP
jgi:anti-sigma B factor antagonist